jgi:hypothetical protein
MVLQLLWVIIKMPETKGVSLEELEAKLIKSKNPEIQKISRGGLNADVL